MALAEVNEEEREAQIQIAQRLQKLLLKHFETKLNAGTLAPTEAATLYKMLKDGGWSLDPSQLPQTLKDKLTSNHPADQLDDDDVIALYREA